MLTSDLYDEEAPEEQSTKSQCTPMAMLAKAGLMPQTLTAPPAVASQGSAGSGAGGPAAGTPTGVPPPLDAQTAPQAPLTLGAGAIVLQGAPQPPGGPGNGVLATLSAEQVKAMQGLIAQLESRMRFLESIILLKAQAPLQVAYVQFPLATLKNYQTATTADPYNHGLGPPHPHMLLAFLQQLAVHPLPHSTDHGLRARALTILLFTLQISTMTGAQVDDICPFFSIHELAGAATAGKVMISWYIRGTVSIPAQDQVEDLATRALAAHRARDPSAIMPDILRSFVIADGIPVATGKPLELGRILLSLLCAVGCTRPIGRAPAGGPVRIVRGKGKGRGK